MIYLYLSIDNPFHKPKGLMDGGDVQGTYVHKTKRIGENKTFELQVSRFQADAILDFRLDLRMTGSDHAGPSLAVTVLGFYAEVSLRDRRHWDHKAGTWEV